MSQNLKYTLATIAVTLSLYWATRNKWGALAGLIIMFVIGRLSDKKKL
jgi:Na+/proline symporter